MGLSVGMFKSVPWSSCE